MTAMTSHPPHPRARSPLTPADLDQIRDLHAQGNGRNEIARALARPPATITKAAQRLGLAFDAAGSGVCAEATRRRAAERRAALALALLDDAERLRRQLWAPAIVYAFTSAGYVEHELPEPPAQDKLALVRALALAIDKHLRLAALDRDDDGTAAAVSLLGSLQKALTVAAEGTE